MRTYRVTSTLTVSFLIGGVLVVPTPSYATAPVETFAYTGASASYAIPTGANVVKVEARGGGGGGTSLPAYNTAPAAYGTGGAGALVTSYRPVSTGHPLTVNVGGGGGGITGDGSLALAGGGGAASGIYQTDLGVADANAIVAGGGGGSLASPGANAGEAMSANGGAGAAGGTSAGGAGFGGPTPTTPGPAGGRGGTNASGGAGGGAPNGGAGGSGSAAGSDGTSSIDFLIYGGGGGGGPLGGNGGAGTFQSNNGGTSASLAGGTGGTGADGDGGGGSQFGAGGGGYGGGGGGGYGGGGGAATIFDTGTSTRTTGGGGAGGSFASQQGAVFTAATNGGAPGAAGGDGEVIITALNQATNVTATAGDASASVSWTEPTQPNGVGAVTYQVFQDGVAVANKTSSPASITGLTPGTSYTFTVVATTAAGLKTTSESASATPVGSTGKQKQKPTGCGKIGPNTIPLKGVRRLLPPGCVTNANQSVVVRGRAVRGNYRLYRLIRHRDGATWIQTYGHRFNLRLTWSAKPTPTYSAYAYSKLYRLR